VRVGDRLRLVRLVWKNDEKCLQCRRTTDRKLIDVPLSCGGQFVEEFDRRQLMSFHDLTAVPLSSTTTRCRRRRVQLTQQVAPQSTAVLLTIIHLKLQIAQLNVDYMPLLPLPSSSKHPLLVPAPTVFQCPCFRFHSPPYHFLLPVLIPLSLSFISFSPFLSLPSLSPFFPSSCHCLLSTSLLFPSIFPLLPSSPYSSLNFSYFISVSLTCTLPYFCILLLFFPFYLLPFSSHVPALAVCCWFCSGSERCLDVPVVNVFIKV